MQPTTTGQTFRAALAITVALTPWLTGMATPVAADGNEAPDAPEAARTVTVGHSHACAVPDDGGLRCWGYGAHGRLGLGDTANHGDTPGSMGDALPAVSLPAGRTAVAISAGLAHTCAVLDDGRLTCWGRNAVGTLGQGDALDRGDQPDETGDGLPIVDLGAGVTATAVTAGEGFTCALLTGGDVKCWGFNAGSQPGVLGLGTNEVAIGDDPDEMGDALPTVSLGTGRTATALAAGTAHVCALLDDGSVKCWGAGSNGALGSGTTNDRGNQPGQMGDAMLPVPLGTGRTATALAAGQGFTCALLDDGTVKCWGNGGHGRLGQGDTQHRGDGPNELGDALPPLDLGEGHTAVAITAGRIHACALLDDATVKCWGGNEQGQLGLGDNGNRGDQSDEMGSSLPSVDLGTGREAIAVTAGRHANCAVLDDASLRCWGENASGQLGLGDVEGRGDQSGEMGDALPPVALVPTYSLSAALAVDGALVFTGGSIDHHLTISNTGNSTLTDLSVSDTAGVCHGPAPDLPPGHALTVDCTRGAVAADVGTISNTAFVDTAETGLVASNQTQLVVAPDRRPDLTVKKRRGTPVGDGLYGADPTDPDQTVTVGRLRGGRVTFVARIRNDGDTSARYRFRRLGTDAGLTVRYFVGGTDVTTAVVNRTFLSRRVPPGATTSLRVEVTVGATASRQQPHHVVLRGLSAAPHRQSDTVRATVLVF